MLFSSPSNWPKKLLLGLMVLVSLLFGLFGTVLASDYSSGAYSGCPYQDGCPAPSPNAATSPTVTPEASPTTPANSDILLNSYSNFFSDGGQQLVVTKDQVIHFDYTLISGVTEHHTITLTSVGSDSVTLTLASTPQQVVLRVGQTGQYDVNDNGAPDIAITLKAITGSSVTLIFRALTVSTMKTPAVTTVVAVAGGRSYWPLLISVIVLVIGLGWFLWLLFRRKRHQNDQSGPSPPLITPNQS